MQAVACCRTAIIGLCIARSATARPSLVASHALHSSLHTGPSQPLAVGEIDLSVDDLRDRSGQVCPQHIDVFSEVGRDRSG